MSDAPLYDVVLIGYGPVSEIMALALARQGRKVAVFERWRERYPLPRALPAGASATRWRAPSASTMSCTAFFVR